MPHLIKSNIRTQSGYSLIELLVAVALTTIGVVGGFYLQNRSSAYEHNLAASVQAELSIRNLTRMMDANPAGLSAYSTDFGSPPVGVGDCWRQACNPQRLADFHIAQWKCQLGAWFEHAVCRQHGARLAHLPQGDGQLQRRGEATAIVVRWRPSHGQAQSWHQSEHQYIPFPYRQ